MNYWMDEHERGGNFGRIWVKMHVLDPGVDTKHSHGIRRHQMSAYGGLIFVGHRFISTSARFY